MGRYDVHHDDPSAVARTAALSSGREQGPRTRAHARKLTVEERLRAGFALSRVRRFETHAGPLDVLVSEPYRRRYPDLRARSLPVDMGNAPLRMSACA